MNEAVKAKIEELGYYGLDPKWRPPSPEDVEAVEVDSACTVPEDYRWFLAHYGPGGFKAGALADLPAGNPLGKSFSVDLLYGLGSRDEWNPFHLRLGTYRLQLPSIFLPVAADPGGNLLVMKCGAGEVFAWDHEHRELGPDGVNKIVEEFQKSDLDIGKYDIGQLILMWENEHRSEIANPTGHGNIYPVAASWQALITSLKPEQS